MKKQDYIILINRLLEQMSKQDVKRVWRCLLSSLVREEK